MKIKILIVFLLSALSSVHSFVRSISKSMIQKNTFYSSKLTKISTLKENDDDSIFGAEFLFNRSTRIVKKPEEENTIEWNKRVELKRKASANFNEARKTFLLDSIFFSIIGLSITWYFGTFKDSYSYLIGSILGIVYVRLLGNYVESIGSQEGGRGGALRYIPVIFLILLYGKYRTTFSIIPELIGFFSYQVSSFFQAFNEDLYNESDNDV